MVSSTPTNCQIRPTSGNQTFEHLPLASVRLTSTLHIMRALLLFFALVLCGCVRNPATGKLQLNLLSESQEVELGKQAKQEAEQAYGVYQEKPQLNGYVEGIGKQLAAKTDRPNLPWSYEIVDDSSLNAFA